MRMHYLSIEDILFRDDRNHEHCVLPSHRRGHHGALIIEIKISRDIRYSVLNGLDKLIQPLPGILIHNTPTKRIVTGSLELS